MKVSDARFAYVLPSKILSDSSRMKPHKAIRIYPEAQNLPWWKAERHIEVCFDSNKDDQQAELNKVCRSCGLCCKDLNTHQIRIFMSEHEVLEAKTKGHTLIYKENPVVIEGEVFYVIDVDDQGDCAMLTDSGCSLGEEKPLWCQMFYCEKLYGGQYEFS